MGVSNLKLSSDSETLAENKILILYILDKIGKPITNDGLLQLITSITDINYFYFQQFLLDLIHSNYIVSYTQNEEQLYAITKEGKTTLELTHDIIPGIVKLKIDSNFDHELENIEEQFSITSDYTPLNEKEYTVTCKVTENSNTIFEVKVFAGSRDMAKSICDNWKEKAIDIYPKMIEILTQINERY